MKRLLWIPLLFLCSSLWAADIQLARMNPYIAGAGVAAAQTCTGTTGTNAETGASSGSYGVSNSGANDWYATKFVTTSAYEVCGADIYFSCSTENCSTQTGKTLTFYIREENSGNPSTTQVGGDSTTVSITTLTSSEAIYSVTFASRPSLLTATTYWIGVKASGVDATDYAKWHYNGSGTTEDIHYSADGSSWSGASGTSTLKFKLYKLE